MKQLLLTFLLLPYLTYCQLNKTVDTLEIDQIEYLDHKAYKKGSEVPFTGILIERYYNGSKMHEVRYDEGHEIEKTELAFLDGIKMISKYFINRNSWEQSSQTNYNSDEQKIAHFDYKNNIHTYWYEDGKIKEEKGYGNNGYRKIWDHNGDIIGPRNTIPKDTVAIDELEWKGDTAYIKGNPKVFTGVVTMAGEVDYQDFRFQNNDYYSAINFIFGKPNGAYTTWYQKVGQKKSEKTLLDNRDEIILDGPYTEWYENGNKKVELNYSYGRKDGLETTWYENGQMQSKANYRNNNEFLAGTNTLWYDNGVKRTEITNLDKKEIKVIAWDENGNVVQEWPEADQDNYGLKNFLDEFLIILKTRKYEDIEGLSITKVDLINLFKAEEPSEKNTKNIKKINDNWSEIQSYLLNQFKKQVDDDFLFERYFKNGKITNFIYDYSITKEDNSSLDVKWPESINYDLTNTKMVFADITFLLGSKDDYVAVVLQLIYSNNKWSIAAYFGDEHPIYVKY
jgi:antitoxin component YwqK of YwqJK toxin-antitoxin module